MTSHGATAAMVSQTDLENYAALRREATTLDRRRRQERDRLLRLVEAGARVEPGPLEVAVEVHTLRQVTKAGLVALLGEVVYEELKAEAPPTLYRRLVVKVQTWF